MTFVDDKINSLNEKDRKNFSEALESILSDDASERGSWLNLRGFGGDYSLEMVRLTLYREMFEQDFSRLNRENKDYLD